MVPAAVRSAPGSFSHGSVRSRLGLDAPGSGVPQYGQLAMADQERKSGPDVSKSDKRKQSLYFPEAMLEEIQKEAQRLQRSMSWVVQRAWKHARKEIKGIPGSNEPGG
jgi:uncharacterized small protein (TIGR04563 family)